MRLLIGIVVGAALGYGVTAYATSAPPTGFPAPDCKKMPATYSRPNSWMCAFPDPPSVRDSYELRVPGLDLTCDLRQAFSTDTLSCSRSSRPITDCAHGVLGSLTVSISSSAIVVARPQHCIRNGVLPGITYSPLGKSSYTFQRNP
jgi:hypothetical protein